MELQDSVTLGQYAEQAYLEYAVSVVKGRALPDGRDGQKPVQRRILYAMNEMGLGPTAKPMKSARVVGDVLGKFHPHGDQAAYEAMVRMAQDFTLRYPLIDGQGNFGSRDGDGAAAMRYTEARLTPIARLLLDEIDQGTVEFAANYDGTLREPQVLPARLPFVLLNGASGIAVGIATEIPSHNLRELADVLVLLIQKPQTPLASVMAIMPGPDFAGGAQIISPPETLTAIYETGRGSIKMRAKASFEPLARGQWQWVVHELPPGASAAKVLEEIEELCNPKIKPGKKALTPDQQSLKQQFLGLLDAARDESGRQAAVRLVFEPKSKNIDQTVFLNALLTHTSLESNVAINLVTISSQGSPGQRGLIAILQDWIGFRLTTILRRSEHRLTQVDDRLHVLAGRLIAWLHIDEVIQIIRNSDEPKAALMARFQLSERQAEDILEIRLRQLAKLEKIKIDQEMAQLEAERQDLLGLIGDESKRRARLIHEIKSDAKQFGDARRTLIEAAERATLEAPVVNDPVTVVVSQNFWVRTRQGHELDLSSLSFKSGDALRAAYEVRTVDSLMAFGAGAAAGRVFSVSVDSLPGGRGDGAPLASMVELPPGGRLAHAFAAADDQGWLLAGSDGYALIAMHGDLNTRQRAGKQFLTLSEQEQLLAPVALRPGDQWVLVLSAAGRLHRFPLSSLRLMSTGGRGLQAMSLSKTDRLVAIAALAESDSLLIQGVGRTGKATQQAFTVAQWLALTAANTTRARPGVDAGLRFTPQAMVRVVGS